MLVVFCHFLANGLNLDAGGYMFPHNMGRLGVLMFFVHTSLVLMMSLERTTSGAVPSTVILSFYIRRAFRIYPLSIVTVCSVALLRIPYERFQTFHKPTALELLSNLTLTQNLTHARSVIGPLWSLPWEVQMYLCPPLVFLIVRRRRFTLLAALTAVAIATQRHRPPLGT